MNRVSGKESQVAHSSAFLYCVLYTQAAQTEQREEQQAAEQLDVVPQKIDY